MYRPADKIKKTVDYVLNEFDSTGEGICYSHFPLCQIDIIDFNPKTNRLSCEPGYAGRCFAHHPGTGLSGYQMNTWKKQNRPIVIFMIPHVNICCTTGIIRT